MTEQVIERKECWITEPAQQILSDYFLLFPFIHPSTENSKHRSKPIALETGMGASTQWLADRCETVTSIEHDKKYFDETLKKLKDYANVHLIRCGRPYNFEIYKFEEEAFDFILIDGRDRALCIEAAIPKIKKGGFMIVDNSERGEYQEALALMKDWNRIDCRQNRPDKYGFTYPNWTTSFFYKPKCR